MHLVLRFAIVGSSTFPRNAPIDPTCYRVSSSYALLFSGKQRDFTRRKVSKQWSPSFSDRESTTLKEREPLQSPSAFARCSLIAAAKEISAFRWPKITDENRVCRWNPKLDPIRRLANTWTAPRDTWIFQLCTRLWCIKERRKKERVLLL